jgi:hypothetical protein
MHHTVTSFVALFVAFGLLLTACYSVGFAAATRVYGRVTTRVGPIRGVQCPGRHLPAGLIDAVLSGATRIVYGFSIAGLCMVMESWLNDRTAR